MHNLAYRVRIMRRWDGFARCYIAGKSSILNLFPNSKLGEKQVEDFMGDSSSWLAYHRRRRSAARNREDNRDMLDEELIDVMVAYLDQQITCNALNEWLAGIDIAQPLLSDESKEALATLRLLCIEMEEGIRAEEDIRQGALQLLRESSVALSFAIDTSPPYQVLATATTDTKQERWIPSIAWVVRTEVGAYA